MKTETKWKLPEAKVKILRWVEKQITEEPKRFDMAALINSYSTERVKESRFLPSCGTVACIAGWYTLKSRGIRTADGFWQINNSIDPWSHAADELGLVGDEAEQLFLVSHWPEPFATEYRKSSGDLALQAKVAVGRIEHFIKTGE